MTWSPREDSASSLSSASPVRFTRDIPGSGEAELVDEETSQALVRRNWWNAWDSLEGLSSRLAQGSLNTRSEAFGDLCVVADDDQGCRRVTAEPKQQLLHDLGILAVERAGRFVREDQLRLVDQGADDSDPLAFAA